MSTSPSTPPEPVRLQATLFDFAILELIRQNRESFQPLWSVDSWAKLLIWLALNCGLSGERESLEHFAEALGAPLTSRLRRVFFERELSDLELQVLADPAYASSSVTAFHTPGGQSAEAFQERIDAASGIAIATAQGPMGSTLNRVGHMGWVNQPELEATLEAIRDAIEAG